MNTQIPPLNQYKDVEGKPLVPEESEFLHQLGFELKLLPLSKTNSLLDFGYSKVGYYASNGHIIFIRIKYIKLKSIPESIGNLLQLQVLDVSDNSLSYLPEGIGKLESLKFLYLQQNRLKALPETIGNLAKLEILMVGWNYMETLPNSIGNLKSLKTLFCNKNDLDKLPESIGNLKNLDSIDLSENHLETLPVSFGNLAAIETLILDDNELKELPESLGNLHSLSNFTFKKNPQIILPETIGGICTTTTRDEYKINGHSFTNAFGKISVALKTNIIRFFTTAGYVEVKFEKYKVVSIHFTGLAPIVPESLRDFPDLKTVSIWDSWLKEIPEWLKKMPVELELRDNTFSDRPVSYLNLRVNSNDDDI